MRVAILDMYKGEPNEGVRCITEILDRTRGSRRRIRISHDRFEVRNLGEVPDLSYDLYISTGGPGSPYSGVDLEWEPRYYDWLASLWRHNAGSPPAERKHALFICHSFQLLCRYFEIGRVCRSEEESFGIFPMYMTRKGQRDPLFAGLSNPFFAADFRKWQVVEPQWSRLAELGADIIALERPKARSPLQRAIMALRMSPEIVGIQPHPEADIDGMRRHFAQPERRSEIISIHGEEAYRELIDRLTDPTYLRRTHDTVLPNFLRRAAEIQVESIVAA